MQKRFLYALFLCFALNGMSPAHAEPTSFLTTIKGYITSIKEYAAGIYKHITGTNMLIGGATLAASALITNYFYASKRYNKLQQQSPENNESSTIPVDTSNLSDSNLPAHPQALSAVQAATESGASALTQKKQPILKPKMVKANNSQLSNSDSNLPAPQQAPSAVQAATKSGAPALTLQEILQDFINTRPSDNESSDDESSNDMSTDKTHHDRHVLSVVQQALSAAQDVQRSILDKNVQLAQQALTKLQNLLQSATKPPQFSHEEKETICEALSNAVNVLGCTYNKEKDYIPSPEQEDFAQKNVDFKSIFQLIYNCVQSLDVSFPLRPFVLLSLFYKHNTSIAAWIINSCTFTKQEIDATNNFGKTNTFARRVKFDCQYGMLHELIAKQLNQEAKKIIASGADLELKAHREDASVGLNDVETRSNWYQTPLIYAVAYNNPEMVKLLLYLNRPSEQEVTDAQRIASTRQNTSNPVDAQITELLKNPFTISSYITSDETTAFNKIKHQRGECAE